jgi:hypothetical protein
MLKIVEKTTLLSINPTIYMCEYGIVILRLQVPIEAMSCMSHVPGALLEQLEHSLSDTLRNMLKCYFVTEGAH